MPVGKVKRLGGDGPEPDPDRPNDYKWNGEWKALEIRQEEIRVRSDFPAALREPLKPVRLQVRRSHLGPIVSDVLGVLDQPVSLRWPALDEKDTSYEAIFRLAYAKDWREFNHAVERLISPAINLVYADSANNIGYVGAGKIPIRKQGDGSLPVPASDPRYEWTGYIPFADMPRVLNPEQGYLVNANNKVVSERYPYFISRDWAPPARAQRVIAMIGETLEAHGKIRFEDVERMQGDVQDLEAARLKDHLLRLLAPEFMFVVKKRDEWPPRRRWAASAVFIEGKSLRETARELKVSYYHLRQHIDAVRQLMQEEAS